LTACANDATSSREPIASPGAPGEDRPIRVASSTDVYGAIVEAVGGDRVSVTSFIDNPGADPEAYESTPADAAAVAAAQLVIGNGGGYDDFLFQLVDAAGGERIVLNVSEFSELEQEVEQGEEFNEHIWFNLEAMQRLADRIAVDLGELAPEDADAFAANATEFKEGVDELLVKVESIAMDYPGARVAATEPLPLYLVADAGLVNVTPEEFMEASEEGTDAPAAVVQETLELVTGPDPVRVLLLNAQTQTPATDRLRAAAKTAGVPEISVNETLSDGFEDYVPWIGAQIDALAAALRAAA
jgi:zinc/manganese transport system substrate-binding protein